MCPIELRVDLARSGLAPATASPQIPAAISVTLPFNPTGLTAPLALLELPAMPGAQYGVAAISVVLVIVCVLLHYEVLRALSVWLDRMNQLHRIRVLVLILGLLVTHVLEIWIYAAGYSMLDGVEGFGRIANATSPAATLGWLDHIYFSFVTFTTVGYGDVFPVGPIRFIAATEALNGWVLIGWSASFTFLEMQRFWRGNKP